MSWVVDPEELIIKVKSRPLLYEETLPEYANKIMKNNAWEDITKSLSEDWDTLTNQEKNNRCKDLQTKWKHLKGNFRRTYQAQKDVSSEQGAKKRKRCWYYDELLFLIPDVKDAKTSGDCSTPTNISEQNTESPPNIENSPAGPSTATRNKPETPKKKRRTTSSFDDELLRTLYSETFKMDEDKTFCVSLVDSLRKMNEDNKILAKIGILNVMRTFLNRMRTFNNEPNQSPLTRPNIEKYFSHGNSNLSL